MAFERLGNESAWGKNIKQTKLATYRLPVVMYHIKELDDPDRPWNVLAGLQLYQAFKNAKDGNVPQETKFEVLDEIFQTPEDLAFLSQVVELQTGTEGVVKSFLESYPWMDWKIRLGLGLFTENIQTVPHISLFLITKGTTAKMISLRNVTYKEMGGGIFRESFSRGNTRFTLWGINRDNDYTTYNFELTNISKIPDRQELELTGYAIYADYKWNQENDGKREYYIFNLAADGTVLTKIEQRAHLSEEDKQTKRIKRLKEVRDLVAVDSKARESLLKFLFPYCDMPAISRHVYVQSGIEAERMAKLNK